MWGEGAKIDLSVEQHKQSETNLSEITLDLEARGLRKAGSVSTENFRSETKPVRHYSEKNSKILNVTESVKCMQQEKRGRGSTDETFGAILLPEIRISKMKKVQQKLKVGGLEKSEANQEKNKNNKKIFKGSKFGGQEKGNF